MVNKLGTNIILVTNYKRKAKQSKGLTITTDIDPRNRQYLYKNSSAFVLAAYGNYEDIFLVVDSFYIDTILDFLNLVGTLSHESLHIILEKLLPEFNFFKGVNEQHNPSHRIDNHNLFGYRNIYRLAGINIPKQIAVDTPEDLAKDVMLNAIVPITKYPIVKVLN